MESETSIRIRIEEYGAELLKCKEYREKHGSPYNKLFPNKNQSDPEFWNNEGSIEEFKTRIDELHTILDCTNGQEASGVPTKKSTSKEEEMTISTEKEMIIALIRTYKIDDEGGALSSSFYNQTLDSMIQEVSKLEPPELISSEDESTPKHIPDVQSESKQQSMENQT